MTKQRTKIRAPKTTVFSFRISDTERGMLETIAVLSDSDVSTLFRGMIPSLYEGVSGGVFDLLCAEMIQAYANDGLRRFTLVHCPADDRTSKRKRAAEREAVQALELDAPTKPKDCKASKVEEQVTKLARAFVGAAMVVREGYNKRQRFELLGYKPRTADSPLRSVPFFV